MNVWMIQIPDNEVSQHYVNSVLPSWENHGFDVNMFNAVTPKTLKRHIPIDSYHGHRALSDTLLGCWESHYSLWEKCYNEGKPITIIEHDTVCLTDDMPIIADFFQITDFENEEQCKNYTERFAGHPYWGHLSICPTTSGYYMTPDWAETILEYMHSRIHQKYVDDILCDFMQYENNSPKWVFPWNEKLQWYKSIDKSKIVTYTRPYYDKEIGGTCEHE